MLAASTLVFASCSDDDSPEDPNVVVPETYTFTRDGSSTVSYSGQSTRIEMAEVILGSLKDETIQDENVILNMFGHVEDREDFPGRADLNASNKSVRSKTAASKDYFSSNSTESNAIKDIFDGYIRSQVTEVFPNWDVDAEAGVAGKIQVGGGSTRYVNAKGLEYNQAFAKGLIGALMMDQMLNNYLSTAVLDEASNVEDNNSGTTAEGKSYTTMEHKWDEAFGYLYGAEESAAAPQLGADSFLNKYLARVDADVDFEGIADEIYDAFKTGRAAIVAKNYTVRDQQAEIIKAAVSKVVAVRAVYYLQAGKSNLGVDNSKVFHDLSEGYGFVQSLRFTQSPNGTSHLTASKINEYLAELQEGNGFWDIEASTLDNMSEAIATAFGFTVEEAK